MPVLESLEICTKAELQESISGVVRAPKALFFKILRQFGQTTNALVPAIIIELHSVCCDFTY